MSKILFLLGTQFFLLWLELWLGACGWPLPLAPCGAVCVALAFGWQYGIAGGVLAGMGRCIYFGGGWNLLALLLYPVLAVLVQWYQLCHEERRGNGLWLAGVLTGIAAGIPAIPGQLYLIRIYGSSALWRWLWNWSWSIAITALLFPVILLLGEALAEFTGLPRWQGTLSKGRRK